MVKYLLATGPPPYPSALHSPPPYPRQFKLKVYPETVELLKVNQ